MRFLLICLLIFSTVEIDAATVPDYKYQQLESKIKFEHAKVVKTECTPQKRPDVDVCKREADLQAAQALHDLRKKHKGN